MKKPTIRRGYNAVKEEEARREKAREQSKGKLWRVFFSKNADEDFEIPVVFLTEEPICYKEHVVRENGKIENHLCTEDANCPYCADGDRPRFVGAFLVVDRSEVEVKDRKTGQSRVVKDRLKLLVRGTTDLAKLERLNRKYGLTGIEWAIMKTGKDTSTTWNFDRGEAVEFTPQELKNIIPEHFQGMDFYDIVEAQILPQDDEEEDVVEDDFSEDDISSSVVGMDEDEEGEEEATSKSPKRRTRKVRSRKVRK